MKAKKWLKKFFLISVFFMTLVGSLNYIVDPVWFFSHSYRFNNLQAGFNERLQKSVYLTYLDGFKYDGVLLGSSRSTYYNSADFQNKKIFNYAVSGIYPHEYNGLIEYFKRATDQPKLEYIILGLDFYGSQEHKKSDSRLDSTFHELEDKNTFMFKTLFNLNTFGYSLKNLKRWISNKTGGRSYTRENFVVVDKVPEKKVKSKTLNKIKRYYSGYETYNENYTKILTELKVNNPDSMFVIYTTPLAKPFLDKIMQNDQLFQHYTRWIKDIIDVYGEIYFFTQYGDFSCQYATYSRDGDHYYPFIGKYILNVISGAKTSENYEDTYTMLNKKNIDQFIEILVANKDNMEILCTD